MFVICTVFALTFIIKHMTLFYVVLIFYIVGLLTIEVLLKVKISGNIITRLKTSIGMYVVKVHVMLNAK